MSAHKRPTIVDNALQLSIVIPAYNAERHIASCLQSVLANRGSGPAFELIVVDNASGDKTAASAASLGARVILNPERGPGCIARSRNLGAAAATAPVLIFLDADMLVPPGWLWAISQLLASGSSGLFSFALDTPPQAGWVGRLWEARHALPGSEPCSTLNLGSANMVIGRDLFTRLGGFDPDLATSEDKDLAFRVRTAGHPVLLFPQPRLIHLGYERNVGEFVRKEFWRQSHTLAFAARRHFSSRSLQNPLFSLLHVVSATLSLIAALLAWWRLLPISVAASILPALLLARPRRGSPLSTWDTARLAFLTWLRWNVSGLACLNQIARRLFVHPGRRG